MTLIEMAENLDRANAVAAMQLAAEQIAMLDATIIRLEGQNRALAETNVSLRSRVRNLEAQLARYQEGVQQ